MMIRLKFDVSLFVLGDIKDNKLELYQVHGSV